MIRFAARGIAIGLMAAALFAAHAEGSPIASSSGTDKVRVIYTPPANAVEEQTLQMLKDMRAFDTVRRFLSPLRLPRVLTIRLKGCNGDHNAYYGDDVIGICYEYLDYMARTARKVPPELGIGVEAATVAPMVDLVLHETGHAVFDMLHLPVLGGEEDAADMFSAYVMLQFAPAKAYELIAGTTYLAAAEAREAMSRAPTFKDFASVHGIPARRYFNYWCLAYGADPKTFAAALTVGHLTRERATNCADEYRQARHAFETLIAPHIDLVLLNKIASSEEVNLALAPAGEEPASKQPRSHLHR